MLGFCDEVCIVDGGSTDGTLEILNRLSVEDSRVKVKIVERDWDHPRFAVFDGAQKAEARSSCNGDFLWQMDSDEVVHENDYKKIINLVKNFRRGVELLALPVTEYWGSTDKVRVDINPWKWRLSRNNKNITHGIPKQHRRFDEHGILYSAGSDGCDYIYKDTHEPVQFISFYTKEADAARIAALDGNKDALFAYENWLNSVVENVPGVHHYSWYDLERKIHTYKNYWSKHWTSLFDQTQEDTHENNKFFGRPWSQVTDADIKELATKMKNELGGWIFHSMVDFSRPTPSIKIKSGSPEIMKDWTSKV
jgi:glycosyltransferase involved in cell wall biosynthesis